MKRRWGVLFTIVAIMILLVACAKESKTYKDGYLGDAAVEENGTVNQIGNAEDGWEDARDQALKEATSGGKKAPGEAFDRAKAEEVVKLVNEEKKTSSGGLTCGCSLFRPDFSMQDPSSEKDAGSLIGCSSVRKSI